MNDRTAAPSELLAALIQAEAQLSEQLDRLEDVELARGARLALQARTAWYVCVAVVAVALTVVVSLVATLN